MRRTGLVLLAALALPGSATAAPPVISVSSPESRWLTPTPHIGGPVHDDGDAESTIEAVLSENGGAEVWRTETSSRSSFWTISYPPDREPLVHGRAYRLDLSARDLDGEIGTTSRVYTVDGRAPEIAITDPAGEETSDATPWIGGTVTPEAGNRYPVWVFVEPRGVRFHQLADGPMAVVDGRFGGVLEDPLPVGDYDVVVGAGDWAGNGTEVSRPLRIVEPPPPEPPGPPPELLPVMPPPTEVDEPSRAVAARAHAAALGALRRGGIAGLRRGVAVPVEADAGGRVVIALLRGRRALASGQTTLDPGEAATLRLRATRRGRRALRSLRRARFTLRATFRTAGTAPAVLQARVTLRR